MNDNTRDKATTDKILKYCGEIAETHKAFDYNRELFLDPEKGFIYRNAITMPILQIGELAKHLSENFRVKYDQIPWKAIAGIRDVFAHNYGSVDYEMTWITSTEDVRMLQSFLENIKF